MIKDLPQTLIDAVKEVIKKKDKDDNKLSGEKEEIIINPQPNLSANKYHTDRILQQDKEMSLLSYILERKYLKEDGSQITKKSLKGGELVVFRSQKGYHVQANNTKSNTSKTIANYPFLKYKEAEAKKLAMDFANAYKAKGVEIQ